MARPRIFSTVGTPTYSTLTSKFGGSVQLDGNNFLVLEDSSAWTSNNWKTIDFWFYVPSGTGTGGRYPLSQYYTSNSENRQNIFINTSATGITEILFSAQEDFTSAGSLRNSILVGDAITKLLDFDLWHHFRLLDDGTALTMWINGVKQTPTQTTYDGITVDPISPFMIGARWDMVTGSNTGGAIRLDEFLIADSVITASSVASFTPPTAPYTPWSVPNTLLLAHFDSNAVDDIGIEGQASLSASTGITAQADDAVSMVFLDNQDYTWDEVIDWDSFLRDRWNWPYYLPLTLFTVSATAAVDAPILAEASVSAQFNVEASAGFIVTGTGTIDAVTELQADSEVREPVLGTATLSALGFIISDGVVSLPVLGTSQLQAQSEVTALGVCEYSATANITMLGFFLGDGESRQPVLAAATLDTAFQTTAQAKKFVNGAAAANSEFLTQASAGFLQNATADDIFIDTFLDANAGIIFTAPANINNEFLLSTDSEVRAPITASASLSVLGFVLTDGISVPPQTASANINAEFATTAAAVMDLQGTANLAILGFVLTEGIAVPPQTAEANLSTEFATSAVAAVTINAASDITASTELETIGGLLILVDDEYDYTWDTIPEDSWNTFVKDRWFPQGFFVFEQIELQGIGGLDLSGSADLSSEFTTDIQASRFVGGSCDITANFTQDTQGDILKLSPADIVFTATLAAVPNVDFSASAELKSFGFILGDAQSVQPVLASATLASDMQITAVGQRISLGTADNEMVFDVVVESDIIRNARANLLSVFDTDTEGESTAAITGTADLNLQFRQDSESVMTYSASSRMEALGFVLSDAKVSAAVTGQSDINAVFAVTATGDYVLLTSNQIFRILAESRTFDVKGETRIQPVLPESRILEIEI